MTSDLEKSERNWVKIYLVKRIIYNLRYIPLGLIWMYQKAVSPFTGPTCRFYPSCSEYARLAIMKHGILKGCIMSLLRISKCHPFHPGGYNPP